MTWSGTAVDGGGLSTFYFTSGTTGFSGWLQTYFQALKALYPPGVTILVPNTGDTIDELNGTLQGVWTDSGGSSTTGTGVTNYIRGVGIRSRWVTSGIHKGRRVIGTTFHVPAVEGSYDTDGTPTSGTITALVTAGNALISSAGSGMVIWSKPTSKVSNDGASNPVLAATMPDQVSWLRTRRT